VDERSTETNGNTPKDKTSMQLEGDRDIVISRTFDAPARIVFDAWTKPEFVERWWAPSSLCVRIVEVTADVRVGGAYRYVIAHGDNPPMGFSGEYLVVDRPTKLVYTQVFEPMADAGAVVVTVTFDEEDGRTRLVSHERYPSPEAREGALSSGMEHGMRDTMNQLDALVRELR
jgi:uncharacterized protein YndB with AHSA1/START domain